MFCWVMSMHKIREKQKRYERKDIVFYFFHFDCFHINPLKSTTKYLKY
ncbi:hypothetical protein NB231_13131 [Nitrococcus mobilis Nb-231]|uniref:Uncharacterized protein n=1 Tax=Nitrococcus mobilis Nb-231 TaxID=314278 RepID=A4BS79_9GAMM|nr:hypothetical protein NB231_13131 [Nitrococcus mobilis Nb-231]